MGKPSKPPGLCLVGPGAIAGAHMRAHRATRLTDPLWLVGPDAQAANGFASEWGFAHFTADLHEALADERVEVVLITSPNDAHAAQTSSALDAGKHVIVEIPMAMSLLDAVAVVKKANAVGRRVLVCHTMRSRPAIRELRERVLAGTLSISQISAFTATPRRNNENWIGGTREWVDNLLWHHCCHYLDAALWILGAVDAEDVHAQFGRPNERFGMTMDASVSFKTAKNELVTCGASYNVATGVSRMLVVADEGLFTLEHNGLVDEHGNELHPPVDWADLGRQDGPMIESILEGAESEFEASSALPVMRLLAAAQAFHN